MTFAMCGKGFFAEDGTVHDCWLAQGHDGAHRWMEWTEAGEPEGFTDVADAAGEGDYA